MTQPSISSLLDQDRVFLVGGAVRDRLMGTPSADQDYVVVGYTPDAMLSFGFQQVGKHFPVFLDEKGEEYALARIERKTGAGYHGFATETDNVTLEQDLSRRDLTINAMAMDMNGNLVDPFGGQKDIQTKTLRHVGDAFSEDPVRVLRIARFAARYSDFSIAPETMTLMKRMVADGEVDHLVPERVWAEFAKSIQTHKPSRFLSVLRECGALARILPEVDALYGVPQVPLHHPEIDTGIHTEMVLDQACQLAPGNVRVAYAALTHDLGKALTPKDMWPKHHDHETLGQAPLKVLSERLKVPSDCLALAEAVCVYHLHAHRCLESRTGTILKLLTAVNYRHPTRLEEFVLACEADKRGRLGLEAGDYPQANLLRHVAQNLKKVSGQKYADLGLAPLEIKEKIHRDKLRVVTQSIHEFKGKPKTQPKHQDELLTSTRKMTP